MKLSKRLSAIAPFQVMAILEKARALQAAGHDVIHLEVGEPDFATPQAIVDAGRAALAAGHTYYTAAQGLAELRQAIAAFYQSRFGVTVAPERIIVTPGASGALQIALSLLVDEGDGVLMADPTYPCNRHFVSLLGGVPQAVPVGAATRYQLLADELDANWQPNTVAAMVATPANPTGTVLSRDEIAALAERCRALGGALIVDEIYQGLTYGADSFSALQLADDAFVINSFSKYFQMTGWRLGWLVVPQGYVEPAIRLAQNLFLCPPAAAQHAALAAFQPAVLDVLESRRAEFGRRRDFLLQVLPTLGWRIDAVPDGAFYVYADVSAVTADSFAYCQRMLDEVKVAITPGADFGNNRAGSYVRVAYTTGIDRLAEAVARMKTVR
ncbi:pyridoxal phosphate-dependent aminotransferase [Vogesella indigofera]|uniref:pyridoxal phosphate-dependent aminotransferase n=1 Tax=Vogesella indigofera TaxID=45465 RepID=UPI00234E4480|nr:pyridoxal phosphate-dependent aminotransferase [Vogesella indigofera]MDC7707745.1 pyridoxal phosphate-dependent aminotransferase [Vogesella indigofera]